MADEVILAKFKAELDDVQREFDKYIKQLDKVEDAEQDLEKQSKKSGKAAEDASKKRTKALKTEEAQIKRIDKETSKIGNSIKATFASIGAGIAAAFSVQALLNFGRASVDAFAEFEKVQISFRTFLGDAQTADKVLQDLEDFSVRTPFTPEEVQQAGKALLAFGVGVDELGESLQRVGDISAGTGKDFNELAVIFGKARIQGVLFAEDINQLTEAGVPVITEFAKQLGVTEREVKKLASQGKITFGNLEQAFKDLTEEGGRFAGLIDDLSQSTAGKLSTIEGEVTKIQRAIGEELAPVLVKSRLVAVELFQDIITGAKLAYAAITEGALGTTRVLAEIESKREREKQKQADDVRRQTALESIQTISKLNNLTLIEAAQQKINELTEAEAAVNEKLIKAQKEEALRDNVTNRRNLRNLQSQSAELAERLRITKLIAAEEEKRLKVEEEARRLEQLLKEQEALQEILKARQKLRDLQKDSDEEFNLIASFQEEIDKLPQTGKVRNDIIRLLSIRLNRDLEDLDKERTEAEKDEIIKRNEAYFEAIQKRIDETKKLQEQVNQIQFDNFIADNRGESLENRQAVASAFEIETRKDLAEQIKQITNDQTLDLEQQRLKQIVIENEYVEKIKKVYEALGLVYGEAAEAETKLFDEKTEKIVDATVQLLGTLTQLYGNFTNARLAEIEREKDAELASIDEQLRANDEALKLRRISESEALRNEKKLLEEKTRAEEAAAKKEREIKRRQFILDKAAALIEITISTAKAVAESLAVPALAALYAALGAAQAAIVASQPVPYAKGTKSAEGGLSLVGEQGPEMTVLPQGTKVIPAKQTKKYEKVFDAMVDDRFEDYVFKNYITPELEKRKKSYDDAKEETFAKNITQSLMFNQPGTDFKVGDIYLEKMSKYMINKHATDIGKAVAKELNSKSIYR